MAPSESPDKCKQELLFGRANLITEKIPLPFISTLIISFCISYNLHLARKIKRFEQLGSNRELTVHKEQVQGCLEYLSIWPTSTLRARVGWTVGQAAGRLKQRKGEDLN